MKKYIKILSILALFTSFNSLLSMEAQDAEESYSQAIEFEPQIVSLLVELAAKPFADKAIQIYEEHGLVKMNEYLTNLEFQSGDKILVDLINLIYHAIAKHFERGDILVHMIFDFYQNSKEEDTIKKVEKLMSVFNNFPEEIRYLLIPNLVKLAVSPLITMGKEEFDAFCGILIRNNDFPWVAKFRKRLNQEKNRAFPEIEKVMIECLKVLAGNVSKGERKNLKETQVIDISDKLIQLAKKLIQQIVYQKDSVDRELKEELGRLDEQSLTQIMDYVLINHIDELSDIFFIDALMNSVYPDKRERYEQSGLLLEKLMQDYPKTVELMNLHKGLFVHSALFINRLKDNIINEMCRTRLRSLLQSEDPLIFDKTVEEIDQAYKRFGFRFIIDAFQSLILSMLVVNVPNIGLPKALEIVTTLRKVANTLPYLKCESDGKLFKAIIASLKVLESQYKSGDMHSYSSSVKIQRLFEELV